MIAKNNTHLCKDGIQSHDCPLLEGGKSYIRDNTRLLDKLTSFSDFFFTLGRKRNIHPSGEFVLKVPC